VYRTSDGGQHWRQWWVAEQYFNDIEFVDRDHGWVVSDSVYATSDGGRRWKRQLYDDSVDLVFAGVSFVDAQTGWVVGFVRGDVHKLSVVYATQDGGETWEEVAKVEDASFLDVCFPDADHGWAVTPKRIFASSDRGRTWVEQDAPTPVTQFWSLAFADPLTGWAAGEQDVMCTMDGGVTWSGVSVTAEDLQLGEMGRIIDVSVPPID
jgi:photosystem II stability/assembly factor-like uncharacterized protein